ncbi:2-epi-5-epi-valiolone synthase [Prodigiosinella confusarubida]|uniref:2-epi-5-epi-valiolone synthase n=1 Tax=Serratia sp. (strain ATCC 39006) TaxID=104623 RepID=A0A2I5T3A9_SERS3|nr:sedoheptulose 7-phosphate cyclase [Serratia sp. ATCC 39006]AUG99043.1 2-epi-5-epi-valiolone synthase [Serratia sp. ATCC 39006]AUH03358.1 2-epi-5-epi-valiolone synthase [Serratia sp. ATCC 39006]WJY15337.1 sedoheptulose 7-phosphate cyclase [Pectobacteriaceae bacterium CE90]
MKNASLFVERDESIDPASWTIASSLPVNYSVEVVPALFSTENPKLYNLCKNNNSHGIRVLVFIDKEVSRIHGENIKGYLDYYKIDSSLVELEGDEDSKNIEHVLQVAREIADSGLLRRSEKIIAIGGGVVMDVVGFTANLYRRGVPYIRIPTTLMGQIDAGIGIKTGINYQDHKNRLGTYYSPVASLIDPTFLGTVSQRHITNGVSEIIKMALVKDVHLFTLLEDIVDELTPAGFASHSPRHREAVERAIDGMLEELEPNLWEDNLERIVDYGHTFSPSLELLSNPPLLHGEAVAVDMALCAGLSYVRGLIYKTTADRVVRFIQSCNLPVYHEIFTVDLLAEALNDTIKHRDGLQRVPLINAIGSAVFCNDISRQEIIRALNYIKSFNN